jgi:hypothetical protein
LNDLAAALRAQEGGNGARHLDGSGQVGRHDVLNLRIGRFLRGAVHPVASVRNDYIDVAKIVEGIRNSRTDLPGVGHVQPAYPQLLGSC